MHIKTVHEGRRDFKCDNCLQFFGRRKTCACVQDERRLVVATDENRALLGKRKRCACVHIERRLVLTRRRIWAFMEGEKLGLCAEREEVSKGREENWALCGRRKTYACV